MVNLPYDRRDSESILEYLKTKAEELSNGRWTDFSNGDVGTVILKLISYIADMNNFQIDKGLAELYIETLTERESALSLVKLIGYEPKGYKSARVKINLSLQSGYSIEDGFEIPKYTRFTDKSNVISFYNIDRGNWSNNKSSLIVYQGTYVQEVRLDSDINELAKIYLNNDKIDPETMTITISGDSLKRVDNVLTDISNTLCYSVHCDSQDRIYVQLPSNYADFIPSGTPVYIEYLVNDGADGNVGSHIINNVDASANIGATPGSIIVDNNLASTGAADKETIEEIQKAAPIFASTMNTLVTLEDIQLAKHEVDGIADIIALDYNSPESGLVQPADAYKVNIYVLPTDLDYIVDPSDELTEVGKNLKEFIDARRLTSIMINYKNVEILTPEIKIVAYVNKYDLRASSLESTIREIILNKYDRSNFGIGEGIYSSEISKALLDKINYCKYIEVQLPDDSYIPTKMQFLEVKSENIDIEIIEE